jgi:transposase
VTVTEKTPLLLSQTGRKLLVIWDGSPVHRTIEVRTYLADSAAKQIHLLRLPTYVSDLNPDEGTWEHLKLVKFRIYTVLTCLIYANHLPWPYHACVASRI